MSDADLRDLERRMREGEITPQEFDEAAARAGFGWSEDRRVWLFLGGGGIDFGQPVLPREDGYYQLSDGIINHPQPLAEHWGRRDRLIEQDRLRDIEVARQNRIAKWILIVIAAVYVTALFPAIVWTVRQRHAAERKP